MFSKRFANACVMALPQCLGCVSQAKKMRAVYSFEVTMARHSFFVAEGLAKICKRSVRNWTISHGRPFLFVPEKSIEQPAGSLRDFVQVFSPFLSPLSNQVCLLFKRYHYEQTGINRCTKKLIDAMPRACKPSIDVLRMSHRRAPLMAISCTICDRVSACFELSRRRQCPQQARSPNYLTVISENAPETLFV